MTHPRFLMGSFEWGLVLPCLREQSPHTEDSMSSSGLWRTSVLQLISPRTLSCAVSVFCWEDSIGRWGGFNTVTEPETVAKCVSVYSALVLVSLRSWLWAQRVGGPCLSLLCCFTTLVSQFLLFCLAYFFSLFGLHLFVVLFLGNKISLCGLGWLWTCRQSAATASQVLVL